MTQSPELPKPDKPMDPQTADRMSRAAKGAWSESFGRESFLQKLNPFNLIKFPILFLKNYVKEALGIKKDKEKVKNEAGQQLTEQILAAPTEKLADEFTAEFVKDAGLKENDQESMEAINVFNTALIDSLKSVENPEVAIEGYDRLRTAAEKDEDPKGILSRDEAGGLVSVGILTLANLKEKFGSERDMREYLEDLQKLTRKSKKARVVFDFIRKNFTSIFQLDLDKLPKALGIDERKFSSVESARDKQAETLEILAVQLFPDSVGKHDLGEICEMLRGVIESRGALSVKQMAKIAFLIETEELEKLADRITPSKKLRYREKKTAS